MLLRYLQRLLAGGEQPHVRGGALQRRGQFGHGVQQVLAVVQHDQHPGCGQRLGQGLDLCIGAERDAQHGSHGGCNQRRIGKRRQFNQPYAVLKGPAQLVGERLRQRSLADAGSTHNGHELVRLDQ